MKNKDFLEGMDILRKYLDMDELHGYNLAAEHDQIWFIEYSKVTGKEDIKRLKKIGWFEDEDSWSCIV